MSIPNDPKAQEEVFAAIKEADASLMRIRGERENVKAVIEAVNEKYDMDKKIIRKMINAYHKQNYTELEKESQDFSTAYESIVK